jgi:hypothetical protein
MLFVLTNKNYGVAIMLGRSVSVSNVEMVSTSQPVIHLSLFFTNSLLFIVWCIE